MTDPEGTTRAPGGTPEGHTAEAPAADEYGKKGTPAGELSPQVPHVADAEEREGTAGGHDAAAADHDAAAAHHDAAAGDHHAAETLGPIDWRAWGAAALGIVIALGIAAALALPTSAS